MDSKQAPPPNYSQQPPMQAYYPPQPGVGAAYPPQQPPPMGQGYPPQGGQYGYQPGYQPVPQMQQPQVQVVTVSTGPTAFRDVPINVPCPHCNQVVCTRVEFENGLLVWLLVGAICFFGIPFFLFLGCCLIPLCIPSIKDVGHYCPVCNRKLGTYQRVR